MQEYRLLINGKMMDGALRMPVINPATEEVIAQCSRASERQLDEAVAAAKAAFPGWAAQPVAERRAAMLKIAETLEANADELARILTGEQGKTLSESKREAMGMATFVRILGSLELPMRALESVGDRRIQAAAGACRRKHRRPEAGRDHPARDIAFCRIGGGFDAAGCAQRHRRRQ